MKNKLKIKTSIIIINWNTRELLENCINSVIENTGYFELVIVDNGSNDTSSEFLKTLEIKENIKVIYNQHNAGFAAANNQGARLAQGKYLCFLNSDTIAGKDWLNSLFDVMRKIPDCGAVGPLGNPAEKMKVQDYYISYPQHKGQFNDITIVRFLAGFCLLISKDDFFAAGGWDEDFLIGNFEDTMLSIKIGYVLKKKLAVTPFSRVDHLKPGSTFIKNNVDINDTYIKNKNIFIDKIKKLGLYEEIRGLV